MNALLSLSAQVLVVTLTLPAGALAGRTDPARGGGLSLTSAQAMALARPDVSDRLAAFGQRASAEQRAAARPNNPQLEYADESVDGSGTRSTERSFWLRQTLDWSGERHLRQQSAQWAGAALMAESDQSAASIRQQVRVRYFDAVYWNERTDLLTGWDRRAERLMNIVREQVNRGESSQYDQSRLEQMQIAVSAALSHAQAQRSAANARLATVTGLQTQRSRSLLDPLPPSAPPALDTILAGVDDLPLLRASAARGRAAAARRNAEDRARMPDRTLGLGHRQVDSGDMAQDGVLFSVEVPIPLLNRNRRDRDIAAAKLQLAEADLAVLRREITGEIRAQWQAAVTLREQALRIDQQARQSADTLMRTAEAAYVGAEIGVMELADAVESALKTRLDALDLTREARQAHTQLMELNQGALDALSN